MAAWDRCWPAAPKIHPAPMGASAPEGQRFVFVGVSPIPQPPTVPSPLVHCACFASAKPPFECVWLFFKTSFSIQCYGRWMTAALSPAGAARRVRGASAAHLVLSAAGRDWLGAGFHGPAGCGWSAGTCGDGEAWESNRDGRDP